ncbi:P-loop ATPase, Sll1717 family [Puia sp.]|jgi:hypothetical protein|uniref:P-loop ATPase, Sll1717 family n=1 Tax=Puia sp. TaxID=2045100 RepID=UPI002F40396E
MPSFEEFIKQIGLEEYPFSTFTTENELGKEETLFIKPNDYSPIVQSFNQQNTIILIGDRGTGKTAILLDFERKLTPNNSLFCSIDNFVALPISFKPIDFYKFLLSNLSITLFQKLSDEVNRINKLKKEEKVLLSYLLKNFVPLVSKRLLKEKIEKIQVPWYKRALRRIFNRGRGVLNYSASIGVKFIDEYIAQHFKGMPTLGESSELKNFFPELPLTIDVEFNDVEIGYQLLNDTLGVITKLGYSRIVVIMDKIDEDSRLENNGEAIADFIVPLLTDNKLLLNKKLQLIVSMWSTPFNYLLEHVRTQKHYCPKLNWTHDDLAKALNKRLNIFSNGKVKDYRMLFEEQFATQDFTTLLDLANSNPRDLWHLFDKLLRCQYKINPEMNVIEVKSFKPGIEDFVTGFNYFEYYPRKQNAKSNSMDFYSYTAHLLKLDREVFTRNQLNEKAGTGSSTQNYVIGMESIGLVEKVGQESGGTTYRIKDPKVIYALKNNIKVEK